jgi:hypothetical protein
VVNHPCRILCTTAGHPSCWNDKTIFWLHDSIHGLKEGTLLPDTEFELFEKDGDGNVITVKYVGNYIIVDNCFIFHGQSLSCQ